MLNRNLPPIPSDQFAMVPRSDVPRSTFRTKHGVKMTFQSGYLIPLHIEEILPGDSFKVDMTAFLRLATPLFPVMDNITFETFGFFVPNRIVWPNWVKMMGERKGPSDSIAFTVPQIVSPAGGFAINSIYDYAGIPCAGQITAGQTISINALPFRAYRLIFQEWFKDENLDSDWSPSAGDGPDLYTSYTLLRRRKRHDYFTSALPWPTKNNDIPAIPLGGQANVMGIALGNVAATAGTPASNKEAGGAAASGWSAYAPANTASFVNIRANAPAAGTFPVVYADLSTATGLALNTIRLAVATQQLLEKDARSGTRYVELLQAHFGVTPQDARLNRPEYVGGVGTMLQTSAIPQTSATGLTGGSSPLGALGATTTGADRHTFSFQAPEHGFWIVLGQVSADLTYQQGLHRMWTRTTRYDYYWPAFANLGEQIVRNDEIYCTGDDAQDVAAFGYQERWAEYRYRPSRIAGMFRSTHAGNIDEWHCAQQFTSLPTLNTTFIEDNPPFSRILAAGAAADNMQILFDSVWDVQATRALPVRSVPGLSRF